MVWDHEDLEIAFGALKDKHDWKQRKCPTRKQADEFLDWWEESMNEAAGEAVHNLLKDLLVDYAYCHVCNKFALRYAHVCVKGVEEKLGCPKHDVCYTCKETEKLLKEEEHANDRGQG
jgi:hypothetical protein